MKKGGFRAIITHNGRERRVKLRRDPFADLVRPSRRAAPQKTPEVGAKKRPAPAADKPVKRPTAPSVQQTSHGRKRKKGKGNDGSAAARKRRKGRRALYAVPVFLIIVIVGVVLSYTVFFKVETVTLDGNTRYSVSQIAPATGISVGDGLLAADMSAARNGIISQFPYAETVEVRRRLPNTVQISISEPELTARVTLEQGETLLISGQARVLEHNYDGTETLLDGMGDAVITDGRATWENSADMERCVTVLRALKAAGIGLVTNVCAVTDEAAYFIYDGRVKVNLGSIYDLEQKLAFCAYFFANDLGENESGTVDVSDGRKLSFRPGALSQEQTSQPQTAE